MMDVYETVLRRAGGRARARAPRAGLPGGARDRAPRDRRGRLRRVLQPRHGPRRRHRHARGAALPQRLRRRRSWRATSSRSSRACTFQGASACASKTSCWSPTTATKCSRSSPSPSCRCSGPWLRRSTRTSSRTACASSSTAWSGRSSSSSTSSPARAAPSCARRLKQMEGGKVVDKTFRAGESMPRVHTTVQDMQFLFDDGANVVLMNTDTYEQIGLPRDGVADELQYLKEGDVVQLLSLDGRPASLQLPAAVELVVQLDGARRQGRHGLQRDQAGGARDGRDRAGAAVRERGRARARRHARRPLPRACLSSHDPLRRHHAASAVPGSAGAHALERDGAAAGRAARRGRLQRARGQRAAAASRPRSSAAWRVPGSASAPSAGARKTPLAMALRGTFLVGGRPAADDLVRRFVLCAAESGIDIFRMHDPLNDIDDLAVPAAAVREAGARLYAGLVYSDGPEGHDYLLAARPPALGHGRRPHPAAGPRGRARPRRRGRADPQADRRRRRARRPLRAGAGRHRDGRRDRGRRARAPIPSRPRPTPSPC